LNAYTKLEKERVADDLEIEERQKNMYELSSLVTDARCFMEESLLKDFISD